MVFHTVANFGWYRSPGGQISFLAKKIEMSHESATTIATGTSGPQRNQYGPEQVNPKRNTPEIDMLPQDA